MTSGRKKLFAIVLTLAMLMINVMPALAFSGNAIFFGNKGFSTDWLFGANYNETEVNAALDAAGGVGNVQFLLNNNLITYTEKASNPNAQGVAATNDLLTGKTVKLSDGTEVSATKDVVVSKTALQTAISAAQTKVNAAVVGTATGNYPQTAVDALNAAIATAQTVMNNSAATQAEVDAAVTALNSAVTTFEASKIQQGNTSSAIASVTVGAMNFKDITLISTDVTGAVQFKVYGSTLVKNIGQSIRIMSGASTVEVSILSADGSTLATGTLDISATNASITFTVTKTTVQPPVEHMQATASVTVGAMNFKDIKVISTNVANAAQFKVAGSTLVKNIGESIRIMSGASTVQVTILAADGTTSLATGTLDISATNAGITFDLN